MKRVAAAVGALALVALLGYAFGRYATPARVETVEVETTRTVVQTKTVYAREQETHTRKRTEREKVTKRDGTVVEHEVTVEGSDAVSRERLVYVGEAASEAARATKTVTSSPPVWHVGALLLGTPRLAPVGVDLFAGVMVSRQLVGPVTLGLTATVPVRQPVTIPTFGVSLGVVF